MTLLLISIVVSLGSVVVMWIYMCRVSAERNGWFELAEVYALGEPFRGTRLGLRSAILNGFAFTGTLHLGVSERGFYLRGGPLLRPFHPPLLVPWSQLAAEPTRSPGALLRFEGLPDMSCALGEKTLRRLSEILEPEWNVQPPWEGSTEGSPSAAPHRRK